MILAPHFAFIVAAYAAALAVIASLIGWVALDYSAQRQVLDDFEKRGVKRRTAHGKRG